MKTRRIYDNIPREVRRARRGFNADLGGASPNNLVLKSAVAVAAFVAESPGGSSLSDAASPSDC